ncbi:MAG: 5-formyltetrahydrofolate cyclo-ligase [Candidatus Omnitrophica bacterium]|nr:5-formyltetrahydrofolate cyclo-ligase [Candidatus Omnitrophota bacterium]
MLTKQRIRSKILLRLKAQKEEEREQKSYIIKKKLFGKGVFQKAKVVMFYIALAGEVDTEEMIKEAQKSGKIVCVPTCNKNRNQMSPCVLDEHAKLKKGPYGVCEPVRRKPLRFKDLELVIVPGVAFDKKGRRLGRGKGCYDYFLRRLPEDTPTLGLAFDFQILPYIPTTLHDVSVNKVIFA